MLISGDEPHRFLIHDRDSIYSEEVDRTITAIGLTILKTPARSPQANAFCERLIGTIRRECLDCVIPTDRGSPPEHPSHMGDPLQSRASAREPGAGHSRRR